MPEVNLLKDTQSPEDPTKKPLRPKPEYEMTDPVEDRGVGHFFKSMLGRSPKAPTADASKMVLNKSKGDQRILKETRKMAPTLAALPEEDDKNLDVNLLTEDIMNREKPREKLTQLILITVGAIVVVGLVFGGLVYAQKSVTTKITETQDKLAAVQSEIDGLQTKKNTIEETVQKISAIKGLIDRHIRWTHFFSLIEKYTLPTVSYGTQFQGDINGGLILSGHTSSYEELAKQYLVYQQAVDKKQMLSSFSITGAAKSIDGSGNEDITFAISMTLLPSAFENVIESRDEQLSILPDLTKDAALFSQYVAGLCYLRTEPNDITLVPLDAQSTFQAVVGLLNDSDCSSVTAQQLTDAHRKLQIDEDEDGLNHPETPIDSARAATN